MHAVKTAHIMALFIALMVPGLIASGCGNDAGDGNNGPQGVACTINSDCPNGQVCGADKFCAQSFAGGDVSSNGDATIGADAPAVTDAGGALDAGGNPGKVGFCSECKVNADCGEGWRCQLLLNDGNVHFCLPLCSGSGDCEAGVPCSDVGDASGDKACIPPNWKCDGCSVTPCGKGTACNYTQEPPSCVKSTATCDNCDKTADCGAKDVCVDVDGNGKRCVPRCDGGQDCGAAASCQPFAGGIEACAWQAANCCYGKDCKATSACDKCADKCVAGVCVDCTKDDHCPDGGKCNLTNNTCVKSACPAGKQQDPSGACVDCLDPTHCQPGQICISGKCETQTQDNVCKLCQDPYPACATVNGQPACVECANDDDCKAKKVGTCDTKTYTCSGTTTGGGPETGDCKTDEDCKKKAGATSKFKLACDVASGLCYDKDGFCDNISAFCNKKAGSECKEQQGLGGLPGSGGGLPGLPGSGGGTPQAGAGVCTCGGAGSGTPDICKSIAPKCDCSKDPKGKDCDPLGILSCCTLGCILSAGDAKPDPACFGGGACNNMGCLSEALASAGGGGGSTSGSQGYCTAGASTP